MQGWMLAARKAAPAAVRGLDGTILCYRRWRGVGRLVLLASCLMTGRCAEGAIGSVGVVPGHPMPEDVVCVVVTGSEGDGCWLFAGAKVRRLENRIEVDVQLDDAWTQGGGCPEVVMEYETSEQLGPLPTGSYLVVVTEYHSSLRKPEPDQLTFSFDVTEALLARIVALTWESPGRVEVRWTGDSRLRQTLESAGDLGGDMWTDLATGSADGSYTEDTTGSTQRFYRVRQQAIPSGRWLESSTCGGWGGGGTLKANEECLLYAYDGERSLTLTHKNACFNCCLKPSGSVEIDPETLTIRIRERESEGAPCTCLCLYDLDYSVIRLEPGSYAVQVEAWAYDSWRLVMETQLDLTAAGSGAYCEPRSGYPWE